MATFLITGMREYSFPDENGELREGMSVYYHSDLEPRDGLVARGYMTEKINVNKGTELYTRMRNADYREPFPAELKFDLLPGRKRPVLMDIEF